MIDPFQCLGLTPDASDVQIRQAYLHAVKQHPPEQDPETFKQIHQAYETIKDARSRLKYQLFQQSDMAFETWLDQAFALSEMEPLTAAQFRDVLRCALADEFYE